MARTRSDQPDDMETATDVNAETAETLSSPDVAAQDETPPDTETPPDEDDDEGQAEEQKPRYRVRRGISYQAGDGEKNAEPGDEVDDIPESSVAWLVEDGAIERI